MSIFIIHCSVFWTNTVFELFCHEMQNVNMFTNTIMLRFLTIKSKTTFCSCLHRQTSQLFLDPAPSKTQMKGTALPITCTGLCFRHDELLAKRGHYAEMWRHQLRGHGHQDSSALSRNGTSDDEDDDAPPTFDVRSRLAKLPSFTLSTQSNNDVSV